MTPETNMELYCGDSLAIMREMPDACVDLVVTDPPYEVSVTSGGGTINNIKKLKRTLEPVQGIDKGYDIEAYGAEFLRVLKEPNIYIWCSKAQLVRTMDFYVTRHKCKFEVLVWAKTNALPTYSNKYISDKEYCLYFYRGKGKTAPHSYEDAKTVYIAPINHADKKKYGHPTIKPLLLTERMIRNSSRPGQIVLDAFMGSGTTGVACKRNGRRFIGIELNRSYYDIAVGRIRGEDI